MRRGEAISLPTSLIQKQKRESMRFQGRINLTSPCQKLQKHTQEESRGISLLPSLF
jgi:hypothetical protein